MCRSSRLEEAAPCCATLSSSAPCSSRDPQPLNLRAGPDRALPPPPAPRRARTTRTTRIACGASADASTIARPESRASGSAGPSVWRGRTAKTGRAGRALRRLGTAEGLAPPRQGGRIPQIVLSRRSGGAGRPTASGSAARVSGASAGRARPRARPARRAPRRRGADFPAGSAVSAPAHAAHPRRP